MIPAEVKLALELADLRVKIAQKALDKTKEDSWKILCKVRSKCQHDWKLAFGYQSSWYQCRHCGTERK